jgi:hypothetical protein
LTPKLVILAFILLYGRYTSIETGQTRIRPRDRNKAKC